MFLSFFLAIALLKWGLPVSTAIARVLHARAINGTEHFAKVKTIHTSVDIVIKHFQVLQIELRTREVTSHFDVSYATSRMYFKLV